APERSGSTRRQDMQSKWMSHLALACAGLLAAASFTAAQTSKPAVKKDAKKEIAALVDKAAALVASKGEAAFPEFRKKGSEWNHDDVYIFVIGSDGKSLVHPTLEGQNIMELKDSTGKAIVHDMMKAV